MKETERYWIKKIAADGAPELPDDVAKKFVKQSGVLVRDHILITVREWNKPNDDVAEGISYVADIAKTKLFTKMKANFTLPTPEMDKDEVVRMERILH